MKKSMSLMGSHGDRSDSFFERAMGGSTGNRDHHYPSTGGYTPAEYMPPSTTSNGGNNGGSSDHMPTTYSAAPYEDLTNEHLPQHSARSAGLGLQPRSQSASGCSYKGRRYAHAEEVTTSQPCLNCTCQRGFVSCFLRVCPTLTAPYNDDTCYLLKEPGSCCSALKCMGLASDGVTQPSSPPHKNKHHQGSLPSINSIERRAETDRHRGRPQGSTLVRDHHSGQSSTSRPSYWSQSPARHPSSASSTSSRPHSSSSSTVLVTSSPSRNRQSTSRPIIRSTSRPQSITNIHRAPPVTTSSAHRPTTIYNRLSTARPFTTNANRYPTPTVAHRPHYPSGSSSSSSNHRVPSRQQPRPSEDEFFRMSAIMV